MQIHMGCCPCYLLSLSQKRACPQQLHLWAVLSSRWSHLLRWREEWHRRESALLAQLSEICFCCFALVHPFHLGAAGQHLLLHQKTWCSYGDHWPQTICNQDVPWSMLWMVEPNRNCWQSCHLDDTTLQPNSLRGERGSSHARLTMWISKIWESF